MNPFTPNHHRRLKARNVRNAFTLPVPVPGARWVPLDGGRFALVDDHDYDTVKDFVWTFSPRGESFYAVGSVNDNGVTRRCYLHRFILQVNGNAQVDHINGNGLDCRRCNMRLCTSQGNNRNRKKSGITTSQFKGVSWDKRRNSWRAYIKVNRKFKYLGRYDTQQLAALAYDAAAHQLFGEFAKPNFPCA